MEMRARPPKEDLDFAILANQPNPRGIATLPAPGPDRVPRAYITEATYTSRRRSGERGLGGLFFFLLSFLVQCEVKRGRGQKPRKRRASLSAASESESESDACGTLCGPRAAGDEIR